MTVSGPICRLPDMLPQFRAEAPPSREDRARGLSRIATGVLMMQVAQLLGKGLLAGQGISAVIDFINALKCILLSASDLVGLASGSYFTSAAAHRDDGREYGRQRHRHAKRACVRTNVRS